jgi:hypothetical protein
MSRECHLYVVQRKCMNAVQDVMCSLGTEGNLSIVCRELLRN